MSRWSLSLILVVFRCHLNLRLAFAQSRRPNQNPTQQWVPDLVVREGTFAEVDYSDYLWELALGEDALHLANEELVDCDAAPIVAKLAEVCDRALHCRQVQVKSFNLVMSHRQGAVLHSTACGISQKCAVTSSNQHVSPKLMIPAFSKSSYNSTHFFIL